MSSSIGVFRVFLAHRVKQWTRHTAWGTGTVAGQVILLGVLLFFLLPVGAASYFLGAGLRAVYPDADVLALINGGMLHLVFVLAGMRFFFQSPPSEQVASYLTLPLSRARLLGAQSALSLLSIHTVYAVVAVVPLWLSEVWGPLSPLAAGAWLATALLLAVGGASHGAQCLHLLVGRQPGRALALGSSLAALAAVGAASGFDVFTLASGALFDAPFFGVAASLTVVGGLHVALVRAMRARLQVDQRSGAESPSRVMPPAYQWVAATLPAGPLVALELRLIFRNRRPRMMLWMATGITLLFTGLFGAELAFSDVGAFTDTPGNLFAIAYWGLGGGCVYFGPLLYGFSAGYTDGLLARPHSLRALVLAKLLVLWITVVPSTLLFLVIALWLPLWAVGVLLSTGFYLWGVLAPVMVYLGPQIRQPVDVSASSFAINKGTYHALWAVPIMLLPFVFLGVADTYSAWWTVAALLAGFGLAGFGTLPWTLDLMTRQLRAHRYAMAEGFRTNVPV